MSTTALITNEEVLAVDQNSANGREQFADGNIRAWVAEISGGKDRYVAVFNLGDKLADVNLAWNDLAIPGISARVRDLWRRSSLGRQKGVHAKLAPHASLLYRISEVGDD